jgi:DNA-binding transcriptional LysR family regulator
MRIDDLRISLALGKTANLHRAAEALGLTPSALSKALARMEEIAGTALFERTPRGVIPTSAGEALIAHASKIVRSVDDLQNELEDRRLARMGTVRLGVVPNLIPSVLSPVLARFLDIRPMANFSIDTGSTTQLLARLRDGELDLILAARQAVDERQIAQLPLPPVRLEMVASASHPRLARLRTLADLTGERWLLQPRSTYLRQLLDQRFASAGLPAPEITVQVAASPMVFTSLIRHSALLSILPSALLRQAEGTGLVALGGANMSTEHDLAILWRADGYISPVSRDFLDRVAEWGSGAGS